MWIWNYPFQNDSFLSFHREHGRNFVESNKKNHHDLTYSLIVKGVTSIISTDDVMDGEESVNVIW